MRPDSFTLGTQDQIGVEFVGRNRAVLCCLRVPLVVRVEELGCTYNSELRYWVIIPREYLAWKWSSSNRLEDIH